MSISCLFVFSCLFDLLTTTLLEFRGAFFLFLYSCYFKLIIPCIHHFRWMFLCIIYYIVDANATPVSLSIRVWVNCATNLKWFAAMTEQWTWWQLGRMKYTIFSLRGLCAPSHESFKFFEPCFFNLDHRCFYLSITYVLRLSPFKRERHCESGKKSI